MLDAWLDVGMAWHVAWHNKEKSFNYKSELDTLTPLIKKSQKNKKITQKVLLRYPPHPRQRKWQV